MAKVCKDIPALMPDITCIDDEGTLSFFRTLLGKRTQNTPSQIKKYSNFSECQNFIDTVGLEALKVALEVFMEKCNSEGKSFSKCLVGAKEFLMNFLTEMKIELWFNFDRKEPEFFNDMDAYGVNLVTRVLLDLTANQAICEGDATWVRAYHKIMVFYMLNTKDLQVFY